MKYILLSQTCEDCGGQIAMMIVDNLDMLNENFEKLWQELNGLYCIINTIYEENEDGIFVDVTDAFEPF
jgi:hypothetical protein